MKKLLAAGALAAGVALSTTACGGAAYNNATYCVNQMTGQVMAPGYCQVGSALYAPGLYDYWVGNTYGHRYGVGTVINHNYYSSGTKVNPSSPSARQAAGIPVSGSVSNGKTAPSRPASPGVSPNRPSTGFSGSKSGTSTSTRTGSVGGFSGGRSSGSSSFSGGRK